MMGDRYKEINMNNFIKNAVDNLVKFCQAKASQPLWPNGPTGDKYLQGLVRDKGQGKHRGSYIPGLDTLAKTITFLKIQDWKETNPVAKREGCKYYQVELPENGLGFGPAYVGVLTLAEARYKGWDIYKVAGEHGDQLVTRGKDLLATNTITLIIEGDMMSTWHPGEPMPETPQPIPTPSTKWKDDWPVYLD
jgi:hypothetical protein